VGSKQLYQRVRASSLHKRQAHQLRGEQQHKGAELGAGDTKAFSKGFVTSRQGTQAPAVISGEYEGAAVHGMLRRAASLRQPRTGNFKAAAAMRLLPSPSLCPGHRQAARV